MIKENLESDLKQSLYNKNLTKANSLRLILSVLKNATISKKSELTEEEIIALLQKEIKKRQEAATIYRQGHREELAVKEENEIEDIKIYLPAQLNEEKIREELEKIISETGATSIKDMGGVMSLAKTRFAGQADLSLIAKIVQSLLS